MTAALTEKRIESIDVAKGIGIALVVFGHIVKLGSPVSVGIIGVIFVMSAVVPIVFLYDRTIRKLINGINSRIIKKAQTGNNP